jgi:hypothetical protein
VSGAIGVGCCWLVAVVFAVSAAGKLRTAAVRAAFRQHPIDRSLALIMIAGGMLAALVLVVLDELLDLFAEPVHR